MPTSPTPLSSAARHAHGLHARKQLARSAHAAFSVKACPADPLALLAAVERTRIPALVAIKHQRMAASPFSFFRGAMPIMAADLAAQPSTGLTTQLCGDAHVENLGTFADDTGHLVFDINDFDETLRGPFEFDLKRLATSLLLAGLAAGIKGSARRQAVLHFAAQYRAHMHAFATMPVIDVARWQIKRLASTTPMPSILAQAERSTPQKSVASLTELAQSSGEQSSGEKRRGDNQVPQGLSLGSHTLHKEGRALAPPRIFQSHPPLLTRLKPAEAAKVLAALGPYARTLQPERRYFLAQYTPLDVAFKVVGTGSVGLRDYVIYLEGTHLAPKPSKSEKSQKSGSVPGSHDPLFLQIKEEATSAYGPYLPDGDTHTHQGHRVLDGQRAMQLTSDPFLGYTTIDGRDFLVRQLNDHKASLDLTNLEAAGLLGYADLCGELFARGHARSGDPVAIAAYLGVSSRFDDALLTFALAYVEKTEHDFALFKKALNSKSHKK